MDSATQSLMDLIQLKHTRKQVDVGHSLTKQLKLFSTKDTLNASLKKLGITVPQVYESKPKSKGTTSTKTPAKEPENTSKEVISDTSVYHPVCRIRRELCALGATFGPFLEIFKIDKNTFETWRATYPEFRKGVEDGTKALKENVQHSPYQKAMGYEISETKIEKTSKGIKKTTTTKTMPPDAQSAMFLLRNLDPRHFSEKVDASLIGTGDDFSVTPEQYQRAAEELKKLGY